jgi:hypothetical protein
MSTTTPTIDSISVSATTTTTTTTTNNAAAGRTSRPLLTATLAVGVVAAVITAGAAAIAHAAGVPFELEGETIPLIGFAQMTLVSAVLGGVIAAVCNRRSARPHHRFVVTTIVLTVLSCIPSVAAPPDVATKVSLVGLHALAGVVVIPVLARFTRRSGRV